MEAIITIPRNLSISDLNATNSFALRLANRGYTFRTDYGDAYGVSLDGVPHDYQTLFQQSLHWAALKTAKFQRLTETAQLPIRGSLDCAGLDLFADIKDNVVIYPGQVVVIPTGLAVQCPDGAYAQIKERSSLGFKGLAVRGGVIDHDYRGEIKVMLQYDCPDKLGDLFESPQPFVIHVGDRVAQIVFLPYIDVRAIEVTSLSPTTRDGGGFGSTGR